MAIEKKQYSNNLVIYNMVTRILFYFPRIFFKKFKKKHSFDIVKQTFVIFDFEKNIMIKVTLSKECWLQAYQKRDIELHPKIFTSSFDNFPAFISTFKSSMKFMKWHKFLNYASNHARGFQFVRKSKFDCLIERNFLMLFFLERCFCEKLFFWEKALKIFQWKIKRLKF